MKTYGQYCAAAKALDVVGDRWSLLIIRELLTQGPCRFTDLKHGLPGIPPNLLSGRLRDLESSGVVERRAEPPPVATALIHLTDMGRELEPVVHSLAQWGVRFMATMAPDDVFRSQWLGFPVSLYLRDREPDGPDFTIEVNTGDRPAYIEVREGSVRVRLDTEAEPELTLSGPPNIVLGVLSSHLSISQAVDSGLDVRGPIALLDRIVPARIAASPG